jgi:hypothetical protein
MDYQPLFPGFVHSQTATTRKALSDTTEDRRNGGMNKDHKN